MDNLKTIEEYILNLGFDLRRYSLEDIDITKSDLRDVILPDDINLFQKIKEKSLYKVKLPSKNYSNYNFEGVDLNGTVFTKDSILPKDPELFQKIKDKELYETILPVIDINNYNFDNVKIIKTVFTKDTKLSADKNFFQKVFNKSIYRTVLPIGDYTDYNIDDLCVIGCDFGEESILSYDSNFFQNIRDKSALNTALPRHIVENIDMYNLNDVEIDLTEYKVNILRVIPLYKKFKNNSRIVFPKQEMSYRESKEIHIKK